MKAHRSFLALALISALMLSACGPAPNPKLQANAKPEEPVREAAPVPDVQPAASSQEPPQQVVAPAKPQPAVKETARRNTTSSTTVARAERPAPAASSADSRTPAARTVTLPGTADVPIPEPVPPVEPVDNDIRAARVDRPVDRPVDAPALRHVTVPSGTLVAVRMIDSVDSGTAQPGETFKASLDAAIVIDGETVFPEGSDVILKLASVQSAGRVRGTSELQLQLDRIFLGRKSYLVESSKYVSTGASQGARTAKTATLGAAIGAAIGAIKGGGKGAVIGGATGAGAGVGVEAIRKGEQVRVDSETRLDFRLEDSVEVTLQSSSSLTPQRNNPSGPVRFGTRP